MQLPHFTTLCKCFLLWGGLACPNVSTLSLAQSIEIKVAEGDSVIISASDRYDQLSLTKQLLLGKNYRRAWSTPVTLPILSLNARGLEVEELGGGNQTRTLRLRDSAGAEWALRSVDKEIRAALPSVLRIRFFVSLVQDMVSAAYPFAPLTISPMASAVGIPCADPTFCYVPDDDALGPYRDLFSGTVCLLEKRDIFPQGTTIKSTEKMLEELFSDRLKKVDQRAYLNARLLDMFIADWDRHNGQWKWVEGDTISNNLFLPIPRDRDQAFFYSDGWLLKFIRLFALKYTVGFTGSTSRIIQLNKVAWNLDRLLLNELSVSDWQEIAQAFEQRITEEVIYKAVKALPPAAYQLDGVAITGKLLHRRRTLGADVMKYYRFLSREVTVYGTDAAEKFLITSDKDSMVLTISDLRDEMKVYYQRKFHKSHTKKVHLLGLGGNDCFQFRTKQTKGIKWEIDGGTGVNGYAVENSKGVRYYDSHLDGTTWLNSVLKLLNIKEKGQDSNTTAMWNEIH